MAIGEAVYMVQKVSFSLSDQASECYDALVLSISALQLQSSALEQAEFLTDAIDACERISTLCIEVSPDS